VPPVVNVGLSVPSQRHPVSSRRLVANVSCSGRCLMGAYARIKLGRSRKVLTRYSSVFLLRRSGRRTIRIGLDSKTAGKMHTALVHGQKVTATIYGAIVDPSGNVEARTPGKELRVRG
jgi:hypothetical protein